MFKTLYDGIITYYVDIKRYMTGWWYTYPSEKYEFVNWDHEIPNMEKCSSHVPNHQPDDIWIWNMVNQIDAFNGGGGKCVDPQIP